MRQVLAVGAHPDDVEVGCFGTLLRHLKAGDEVHVVITTKGGYLHRTWNTIESEMRNAEKILEVKYTVLENPIGHYPVNMETVSQLDKYIKKWNVDTVYCDWYGDSHQDHRAVFQNTLAACRKRAVENLYCYELPMYEGRSQLAFKPQLFVDVTEFINKKLEAIKSYTSYFKTRIYLDAVLGLARQRGMSCGTRYAEAFEIIFETWK